ncbi:MAG: hypothetical protein LBH11_06580 [Propionibacteriaceae bacterium]|nr:hypothetical protein [Propionibacteriaceae bacterium]
MSNTVERYALREPVPIRTVPGTLVVLAAGIYFVQRFTWEDGGVFRTAGFVMIALGIIFPILIVVKMFLNVVRIELSDEGITAKGPKVNGSMRWEDVTNWAVDPKGSGLVLVSDEKRLKIISPNGRGDADVFALGEVVDEYVSAARAHLGGRAPGRAQTGERVQVDPDSDFGFDN